MNVFQRLGRIVKSRLLRLEPESTIPEPDPAVYTEDPPPKRETAKHEFSQSQPEKATLASDRGEEDTLLIASRHAVVFDEFLGAHPDRDRIRLCHASAVGCSALLAQITCRHA